ncbi:unnamed protein product [Paramecium sonneborni]|uniref:EGF-like domain-containing protein n=1 Tax=Paramecium sonneborni TaxID=65129 RepID=A0A8S1N3U5_9CILI|nr:unnamed protein product [Paramecium sonneborni]
MQLQQNKLISTGKSMINSTFKTNFVQFFFFVLFSLDQTEQSTVYENLFGTTAINDWQFTVYNQYCNIGLETCDTSTILSINQCQNLMYDVFLYKTFQLQAHYELSISFKFWRIDNWQNKKFLLYIDLQLVYSEEYSTSQGIQNICQDSNYNDEIYQIQKTIDHFYSSATIIMIAEQGYWGISEIVISIADCPQGCESCNQNGCINENLFLSMLNYILINSISDSEGWITDGILQTYLGYCLDFNYLRSQGDHLIKEFQLESHSAISFQFKVIILNSNPTLIQIEIDDVIVETIQYSQSWVEYSGVLCSYITLRYVKIQSYQHNNINLKLAVKGSLNLFNINYSGPGIRIRDFKLFLQSNQNNVIESAIYFYEYSDSPINLEGCSELINSVCWNCFEGWQFNQLEQSCIPICGDRIITQFEECDDGNNFPYDGCHLCKFSCPLFCNQCLFGKCFNCQIPFFLSEKTCQLDYLGLDIFKILQYQEPYLQNQVTFFPKDDINVQNQYQIDYRQQLNEIQNLNKNISQSQNLDQNEYHFTKIDNCRNFQFGTCLQCHESYEFNLNKKQCLPKCSDGIIIQYEECDDQNNIQFDRCYKCQMSCQIQCITCKNSICLQCLDGWQLLEDTCQQICGDGQIAILSIEQCDDGNNQAYDGCYECKFECDSNCLYCVDNYYCLLCKTHFELNNNYYCQPICGDGIIIQGFEDCDNSNNDQSDSECDIGCEQCELGSCKQCNLEYQLINGKCNNHQIINNINQELEIYQSIDKCGDGILGLNEECDDQNNNDNDGCSKLCQIEANWNCYVFIYQPSDCFQKTSLFLSYLNQTNQYQYVKISFTNNIDFNQIPDNFNSSIKFIIQDVKKEDYAINFLNVIDTNQKINQSNYELEIEMKKSFQSSLTLIVWIESILFDENLFIVDTGKKSLKLKPIKILSQTQISISNTFKELGFGMLLGLGCSIFKNQQIYQISQYFNPIQDLQMQTFHKTQKFTFNLQILYLFNLYCKSFNQQISSIILLVRRKYIAQANFQNIMLMQNQQQIYMDQLFKLFYYLEC